MELKTITIKRKTWLNFGINIYKSEYIEMGYCLYIRIPFADLSIYLAKDYSNPSYKD